MLVGARSRVALGMLLACALAVAGCSLFGGKAMRPQPTQPSGSPTAVAAASPTAMLPSMPTPPLPSTPTLPPTPTPQATPTPAGLTLRYSFKPGESYNYIGSTVFEFEPAGDSSPLRTEAEYTYTLTVERIEGGTATLSLRYDGLLTSNGGRRGERRRQAANQEELRALGMRVQVNSQGRILRLEASSEAMSPLASTLQRGALFGVELPERALQPGDSWQSTSPEGTSEYTFEGTRDIQGRRLAVITASSPVTAEIFGGKARGRVDTTLLFDPAQGKMVQMQIKSALRIAGETVRGSSSYLVKVRARG